MVIGLGVLSIKSLGTQTVAFLCGVLTSLGSFFYKSYDQFEELSFYESC